ncbi:MAG: hypothetical protein H5T73_01455 [Actinobacteria bacterium]|nr:hypothetical protein [Actinomycetota bacterium]
MCPDGSIIIGRQKRQHHRKTPSGGHSQRRSAHRRKPGFSPERQGGYSATRKGGTLAASRVHGLVLNELARELSGMGFEAANTGLGGGIRPALVLMDLPTVVEVKSEGEWEDVIHGTGQCFVYSALQGDHAVVRKVLVLPAATDPEKLAVLGDLGIHVVKWRQRGGKISFTGLKRALPKRTLGGPEKDR